MVVIRSVKGVADNETITEFIDGQWNSKIIFIEIQKLHRHIQSKFKFLQIDLSTNETQLKKNYVII